MIVEAFVVVRESVIGPILSELRAARDEARRPTQPARAAAPLLRHVKASGTWRKFQIQTVAVVGITALIPAAAVARLLDLDPGKVRVVDVFMPNGLRLGLDYDDAGGTTGTPTYPPNPALLLECMPDVVTRDHAGNETGRSRPAAPYEAQHYMGWQPRRYA